MREIIQAVLQWLTAEAAPTIVPLVVEEVKLSAKKTKRAWNRMLKGDKDEPDNA